MTDHDPDHDDVLKELDAALHVEPSRRFADDVRARVAAETRARTRRMWWGLAAAASVTLATAALWRSPATVPEAMPTAPTQQASAAAVPDAQPESVIAGDITTPTSAPVRRVASVSRPALTSSEPRLEVITNQSAVLRQLWADYRGRPLVVAEGEPVVEGLSTKAIAVETIEVRPIVVSEIGKEPGPAGATPIIRRVEATKETR